MTLAQEAVRLLTTWVAPDPHQDALRQEYLRHLATHPDGVWKDGPPVHLTASCFVLDPSRTRTLLTHHRKGGFWVQFGGHCEPGDADLAATALREGREESGVSALRLLGPAPVDLHAHDLPAAFGRCTRHLDVAFVAGTPAGAVPVASAESLSVAWFDVDDLPPEVVGDLPARLRGVVRRLAGQADEPYGSGSGRWPAAPEASEAAASSPSRKPRARSVRG